MYMHTYKHTYIIPITLLLPVYVAIKNLNSKTHQGLLYYHNL